MSALAPGSTLPWAQAVKKSVNPIRTVIPKLTTIAGNSGVQAGSWYSLYRKSHDAAAQHPAKVGPKWVALVL